eukprot:9511348-Lingulodinium_polyedra.AAC.1
MPRLHERVLVRFHRRVGVIMQLDGEDPLRLLLQYRSRQWFEAAQSEQNLRGHTRGTNAVFRHR